MEQLIGLQKNNIEEIFQRLKVEGWEFVKAREYQGTYIFKSQDEKRFLHFGNPGKIKEIGDVQDNLYKNGYPVAPVLEVGSFGEFSLDTFSLAISKALLTVGVSIFGCILFIFGPINL